MGTWLNFYVPHFDSRKAAEIFVRACETLKPSAPNHIAKVMMHQTQRMVSIVDDLPKFRPHQEALQVLFLVMCTENIAKLHDGFCGEGKSRHYVRKFFDKFLSKADEDALACGFVDYSSRGIRPIGFSKAVDLLYRIRCDVVHEGNYSFFAFHDGNMGMVNTNPNVSAEIQLVQVRDIVVRGCIGAIRCKLSEP